jgi:hypothetical protein
MRQLGLSITLACGDVVWLGMLGFVDDKCLLSTSFSEMQDMLDVCGGYGIADSALGVFAAEVGAHSVCWST